MGIVVRQALKGTVAIYAGVAIGLVNTLWLMPYVLSAEEIGLYRVFIDLGIFLTIFSQLGMNSAGIRFFPHFKAVDKEHHGFLFFMFSVALTGFLLISALFLSQRSLISEVFTAHSSLLLQFDHLVLPLTFLLVVFAVLDTYSRSLLRIVVPRIYKDVVLRILMAIIVVLYFYKIIDLTGFVISILIAHALIVIGLVIYVKWLGHLFLRPVLKVFRSAKTKEIATFCMFSILAAGSGVIVGKIDTLMLSSLAGLSFTGIYSIAFYMGIMVEIPKRSLVSISAPLVAKHFVNNELGEIHTLYKKTSTHLALAGGLILILIWFNIDDIFKLVPNSEIYAQGKYVVLFIGLAKWFDLVMSINSEILVNSPKYRWNLFLMPALAVLAIATNLIFIPRFGIQGAAIASLISILTYNIFRYLLVLSFFKIHPFSQKTLIVLSILVVSALLAAILPAPWHPIINIAYKSALVACLSLLGVLVLKPSEELDRLISKTYNMFFNRN